MRSHDLDALLQRSAALLMSGPNPAVRALLEAAEEHFPAHAGLVCRLADALHLEGRLDEAATAYRRALALDSSLLDGWYGLGAAQLKAGAFGSAVESLRQAVALRPDAAGSGANLAEALYALGEVDPALVQFRSVEAAAAPEVQAKARANIACIVPGSPAASNAEILAERRRWVAALARTSGR